MDWQRHAATWPNAAHSRFVETQAHRWHIQRAGKGPGALLLHGAGASTHSWRGMFPLLAEGAEADIALIDPEKPWIVDKARMEASAGNTPFDKQPAQGRVLALFKGGVLVHD